MDFEIKPVQTTEFPPLLREIPDTPTSLTYRGNLPPHSLKLLSIVGSRKYTTYGKQVVDDLLGGLKGYPIGIVSGLALGIDSLAHQAALKNNLYTLAIPGGGLEDSVLYPASHKPLAHRILENGGGLLSEFEPTFTATAWSFPKRNRLVAGISHATLLIEATEKSGTLITARLATDYNRELLAVPGNIFSKNSQGVHQFIKLGATPVTDAGDILDALHLEVIRAEASPVPIDLPPKVQQLLELLTEPTHRDELIRKSNLSTAETSQLLMQMELKNLIVSEQNVYRACR